MRHAVAVARAERVKPAFTVEKLEGKVQRTVHMFDPNKRKIVSKNIDVPAGYMVKFAKGHSNRLTENELERLMSGDPTVALVDMETGETVGREAA